MDHDLQVALSLKEVNHGLIPYGDGLVDTGSGHSRSRQSRSYLGRLETRTRRLADFIHDIRPRRGEIRVCVRRHPGDAIGEMRWIPAITRGESLTYDELLVRFIPKS